MGKYLFKRGGAGSSGSGGGPCYLAENCRLGIRTTICGGSKKAGEGFTKDGSEACRPGGGPGWLIGNGVGSGHGGLTGSKDGGNYSFNGNSQVGFTGKSERGRETFRKEGLVCKWLRW